MYELLLSSKKQNFIKILFKQEKDKHNSIKWEGLNVLTVPTFKMPNIRTVPTFRIHKVGTVPTSKRTT